MPTDGCLRVLVVDDDVDTADSFAILLRHFGYEVAVAYGSAEALRLTMEQAVDVILLDLAMPRLDGYETLKRLRERPHTRVACIVAMTGFGQSEDRERTRRAGFDEHLVKPVEPDVLRDFFDRMEHGRRSRAVRGGAG